MTDYIPYYYVIGWTALDRWYVGSRYANSKRGIAHPSDLMVTYFTSSTKYVHPFIEEHGLPDVVWTYPCKTAYEARFGEYRIMNEFHNFISDERWINKIINGNYNEQVGELISKARTGVKHTKPSWNKGIPCSEEVKQKISEANKGQKAWNKGRTISEEERAVLSAANKKRWEDPEFKAKISAQRKGKKQKPFSEEHKRNIGKASKGRIPWNKGLKLKQNEVD